MRNNRYIKIAVFLVVFFNVSIGQIPLEIRNNSVVGLSGIIVNKTSLNETIDIFSKNPHTVVNFQLAHQEPKFKIYRAFSRASAISFNTMIIMQNNVIAVVMVKTFGDENEIKVAYRLISQKRVVRLGYPSTESAGMLEWNYPNSSYALELSRTIDGTLQIMDIVSNTAIQ